MRDQSAETSWMKTLVANAIVQTQRSKLNISNMFSNELKTLILYGAIETYVGGMICNGANQHLCTTGANTVVSKAYLLPFPVFFQELVKMEISLSNNGSC
jgi:hypothetical protein